MELLTTDSPLESRIASSAAASAGLRDFIALLSTAGKLKRVSECVDWKFEIGTITRRNQVPLLFENIKGYPGHRVFTNGLSSLSSIAIALGMDSEASRRQIVREAKKRAANPVAPVSVGSTYAPENVLEGREIDFLKLPVPQWSPSESHRYIGTWHINVTRDPETGIRNLGTYRMQVLGPRHATLSTSRRSHLALHLANAEKAGQPLEMAVAIGVSEALVMAAAAGCAEGQDEYDLAGGLQGRPVAIAKCSTVDLEVPADAEIVIEGVILPGRRFTDGPYFDYAGLPNLNPNAFIFEAKRMAFRDNPIFRGAAIGCPGAEDQQLFSLLAELSLFDFHGSRARRFVQKCLIANRLFRSFQFAGKI